jgi:N-acetyl-gamma-glutamyl-phosphate reductase
MNDTVSVGILGATGYAGTELVRLLGAHPRVRTLGLASRQFAGRPASEAFPGFSELDLPLEGDDVDPRLWRDRGIEVVFAALPHGAFAERARAFLDAGQKVIDLSADFRPGADRSYEERHGMPHPGSDLLDRATYGLTEWLNGELRQTHLVANPGCYATAVLLSVLPAITANWWSGEPIVANALSGVTGSGRAPSATTHFVECGNGAAPYRVGEAHAHLVEIRDAIRAHRRPETAEPRMVFNPHLVPMARGIVANVSIPLAGPVSADMAADLYRNRYRNSAFIRVIQGNGLPETRHVRGSNRCDVAIRVADAGRLLLVFAALDNLVKGAAGQAVQNMNRMMDWPETIGLPQDAWVNA